MSNREERRSAAREGILAAAHRLVAEGGCAAASVAAIAARAGVAPGSLYRHFPSRAELLAEVIGDALRGERALLERAAAGLAPRAALSAWVRTTTERALLAPGLAHALGAEPAGPEVDAVRLQEQRAQQEALATLLEAGTRAGAWPPGDTPAQAAAIAGALRGALVGPAAAARLGAAPDPHAEAETLIAFVLGAVRAS